MMFLCFASVLTHKSRRAAKDMTLFKLIFPERDIACKMQLSRTIVTLWHNTIFLKKN